MRAILYDDSSALKVSEVPDLQPGAEEIRVKTAFSGINRADLLQKKGLYPPPTGASEILGLEVSGIITEVGKHVQRFKVGDRVMGLLSGGGYAEYVVAEQELFFKLPDGISLESAGGIPEVFLTAYQALFILGKLHSEDKVLIHAGASGVGSAAIQLATSAGAQVFVTAGSDEKTAFCRSLGAEVAINYHDQDFEEVIGSNRIDLVVDVIGGDYFSKNINLLTLDGRYVLLAFMGGAKTGIHLGKLLSKRIHLMGSTLRSRSLGYRADLISSFVKMYQANFENESVKPVIDRVYDVADVEKAHDYMEQNLNMGKILLRWS